MARVCRARTGGASRVGGGLSEIRLLIENRRDALGAAADPTGRPAHLLGCLGTGDSPQVPLGDHLVFKGSTSPAFLLGAGWPP